MVLNHGTAEIFSRYCFVCVCVCECVCEQLLRSNPSSTKHRILQKPIRDKVQVSTAEKYIASKIVFRAEVASPSLIYDEFFCIQNKRTFRHSGLSYHIRVKGERHPLFVSASAVVSDEGVRLFFCPCWMDNEEKVNELEAQLTSQLGG